MNDNFKSLAISAFLHGALLCSFMSVGTLVPAADMAKAIDFSLVERLGSPQKQAGQTPPAIQAPPTLKPVAKTAIAPNVKKISVPVPVPVPPEESLAEKEIAPLPAEEFLAEKEIAPDPAANDQDMAENIIEEVVNEAQSPPLSETITAAVPTPAAEGHGQSADAAKSDAPEKSFTREHYVRANFHYIKDNIQKGISYPRIARQLGWEGKVVVSFVVDEDGSIRDLRIVESSGFAALDKNAIATIKKAAPFPRPTVRAELVVPVVYRLA